MANLNNTENAYHSTDELGRVAIHYYPLFNVFLDRGDQGAISDITKGQLWPRGNRINSV